MTKPLTKLKIIGVRYRNAKFTPGDHIPLDTYAESGIYEAAKVPFELSEPFLKDCELTDDEVLNIGTLGGKIADITADARNKGYAICMTGGNCCHITGIVGGLQEAHGSDVKIGLVWFDAHGDFNTHNTTLSGMLGGMPVAVAAGLTQSKWRDTSQIVSPLPTDRIVLVDVRNLDPAEEQLIRATDTIIASIAPGYSGDYRLEAALSKLIEKVDLIYFHIDADILDESYTPNHFTKEPNGPNMVEVKAAIESVMATGKVGAFSVVSVPGEGEGAEIMVNSGKELIRSGLEYWKIYGMV